MIVDDDHFAVRIIDRIRRKRVRQGQTKEKFLYNFLTEMISMDLVVLNQYERKIMRLEECVVDNENRVLTKKNIKYFDTFVDRADRLMGRTIHLLEYATQVRDSYQEKVSEQQNKNMQFLTVVSTIFYPLTLITGWYGMNFHNMPELEHGYPGVVLFSILVVIAIILIFKKKKII